MFKRNKPPDGNADIATNTSISFKYESLKYLSNYWKSLTMPLINSKIYLKLNRNKDYIMFNNTRDTTFKITGTKLYVPIAPCQLRIR